MGDQKKVTVGLPFSLTSDGVKIGTVKEFDEATGIGLIVLKEPMDYETLEEYGINFSSYVDYE